MTHDGSQSPRGKPTLIGRIGPWLLVIPSALAGILLVELFCGLFFQSVGNLPGRDRRVVFFDGRQPIFENHDGIFNYTPHNAIRQVIVFFTQDEFFAEFDYRYRTNNYGLVQESDIGPGRASLILLGDSFTEGQGAEPWFRQVSPVIDKLGYQPINGGVLGTGFQEWLRLNRYLVSNDIQIRKAVILFISDDYRRPAWDLPKSTLTCLSSLSSCHADESYFYRLPDPPEMSSWIAKVRTARQAPRMHLKRMHLKLKVSALLPASYGVYSRLRQQIVFANAEQGSRAAISKILLITLKQILLRHGAF
jgi:hypothetical protein